MKLSELFEADIIDLKKYKKDRDTEQLKQKLLKLANVDVPSAFQKQNDIEELVKTTINDIKKRSKTQTLDIAPPALMKNFQPGLPKIKYLEYNLPIYFEVDDSYATRELRGANVLDNYDATILAIQIAMKNADIIIKYLENDMAKANELHRLAENAPAYTYAASPIYFWISEISTSIETFEHITKNKEKWLYYIKLLKQAK